MSIKQGWKFLAVAVASFAIAAMARTQFDGGMPEMEHHMHGMDAGAMEHMDMDAGVPGDMQGSLRGTPRSLGKSVVE